MNKLDSKYPSLTVPAELETAGRLIVLVPCLDTDLNVIAGRVWELAAARNAEVQFLGLYQDAFEEPGLRRKLVTLSAMVRDERVSAGMEVLPGKDWVEIVREHSQAGDMLVCFAEQRSGFSQRPLSEVLQSELDLPVYILSGLYPRGAVRPNRLAQLTAWSGSLAMGLGFFLLQIRIVHLAKDGFQIALLLMTVGLELWMIWAWNGLFESHLKN
jgi:hypothetical protein